MRVRDMPFLGGGFSTRISKKKGWFIQFRRFKWDGEPANVHGAIFAVRRYYISRLRVLWNGVRVKRRLRKLIREKQQTD